MRDDELLSGQSSKPALARVDCGEGLAANQPPRHDLMLVRVINTAASAAKINPTLTIESEFTITLQADNRRVLIGGATTLVCPQPFQRAEKAQNKLLLCFPETTVAPGKELLLAFGVGRGKNAADVPRDVAHAESLRKQSARFWENVDLP